MSFSGKVYWREHDQLLQCYDTATGALTAITNKDAGLPAALTSATTEAPADISLGSISLLGDSLLGEGRLLVGAEVWADSEPGAQRGFTMGPGLNLTASVAWRQMQNTYWGVAGYTNYTGGCSIYDAATGLNWHAWTTEDASTSYVFTGLDHNGNVVDRRADSRLITTLGDDFLGGRLDYNLNMSLLGRWLYRGMPNGDGVQRYNLDSDTWQAAQPEVIPGWGYTGFFVGVDSVTGRMIHVHAQNESAPGYAGNNGYLEVRDPEAPAWEDPVPNGITTASTVGPPIASYSPWGTGGPASGTVVSTHPGFGSRSVTVHNGFAYYFSRVNPVAYDANGMPTGLVHTLWEMDLANGSIAKIADVPFRAFAEDGTAATSGANYYVDNYGSPTGLVLVAETPAPPFSIDGGAGPARRRFTSGHPY